MKNKVAIISIFFCAFSFVVGLIDLLTTGHPPRDVLFEETVIDYVILYNFLFIYLALPVISFILSFFSKKGFLKYVAIYGSLSVMFWHIILPAIIMTFWVLNPVP